jgi:hypothetical protein
MTQEERLKEYLRKEGIHNMEQLKKAIEEMPKINLALFKGAKA